MSMEKQYCDRCKRIDENCGAMITLQVGTFYYRNLRKSLSKEFLAKEGRLNKYYAQNKTITLCDDCFAKFIDFKNDEILPTPNETKVAGWTGDEKGETASGE